MSILNKDDRIIARMIKNLAKLNKVQLKEANKVLQNVNNDIKKEELCQIQ